jgi:hypothetical protein
MLNNVTLRNEFVGQRLCKRNFTGPIWLDFPRSPELYLRMNRWLGGADVPKVGVEIGTREGRNAHALCAGISRLSLRCIDPYASYGDDECEVSAAVHQARLDEAVKRTRGFDVSFDRRLSMNAARDVPLASLDFAYIDGNHLFDYAMEDLIAWSRRVKRGGIVCIHDYVAWAGGGVVPAVDLYTQQHGIVHWFVTVEKFPTAFWVNG